MSNFTLVQEKNLTSLSKLARKEVLCCALAGHTIPSAAILHLLLCFLLNPNGANPQMSALDICQNIWRTIYPFIDLKHGLH